MKNRHGEQLDKEKRRLAKSKRKEEKKIFILSLRLRRSSRVLAAQGETGRHPIRPILTRLFFQVLKSHSNDFSSMPAASKVSTSYQARPTAKCRKLHSVANTVQPPCRSIEHIGTISKDPFFTKIHHVASFNTKPQSLTSSPDFTHFSTNKLRHPPRKTNMRALGFCLLALD